MSDSLRQYFCSRVAYKNYLRSQKAVERGDKLPENVRDYFAVPSAHERFRRIYEALRSIVDFHGIKLVIEIAAGETFGERQEPRKSPSPNAYGSIENTIDRDQEPLDFFLGSDLASDTVAVIDQLKPDGSFDEHKCLLAFRLLSEADARIAYLANYEEGWQGFGGARLMSVAEFKAWLETYDPTKPVSGTIPQPKALAESSGASGGYISDWSNIRCPACGERMTCACARKHNECHDPATGEFCSTPGAGGSSKPSTATGPSKPAERHNVSPPIKEFRAPPPPQGSGSGRAGGFAANGKTNTEVGDRAEKVLQKLGLRSILPEGKRQNPLDVEYDHSGFAFEVKAVTTKAKEYKAKPKKSEMEEKRAYAQKHDLKPGTIIAVVDHDRKEIHAYWRPGIGAFRLTESGSGWNYMGTVSYAA